ncbi:MAG: F0F1 ATP synthase subunit gamma [Paludibacter sp.]
MASLKEIKTRIHSVKSTQKITSAMKMVSSAKLRKAQKTIENLLPYEARLNRLLNNFLSSEEDAASVYAEQREVKRVAIIVFSSNTSLCGGFNANVAKRLTQKIANYHALGHENVLVFPVGKKVAKVCRKMGIEPQGDFEMMADKPSYSLSQEVADQVMSLFSNKEVDKVELIYHHFKSKSTQELTDEVFLPIPLVPTEKGTVALNYIVEPNHAAIMDELIPKVLRLKIYTALLDSNASEHAARTMAMQIATDNADDILQELSLLYNKSRQQAITNELLDILGGSFK